MKNKFKRMLIMGLIFAFFPAVSMRAAEDLIKIENFKTQGAKGFLESIVKNDYDPDGKVGSYSLIDLIASITFVLISLLGMFFIILMIYAGFLWMTANGNEDQITKAKGLIANSTVGLLIIFSAFAISWYVLDKMGGKTLGPESMQENSYSSQGHMDITFQNQTP